MGCPRHRLSGLSLVVQLKSSGHSKREGKSPKSIAGQGEGGGSWDMGSYEAPEIPGTVQDCLGLSLRDKQDGKEAMGVIGRDAQGI